MSQSETQEASPAPPRRRRRRWLIGTVVVICLIALAYLYLLSDVNRDLHEAIAETDRLDPKWTLEDLEEKRAVLTDEENSALTSTAVKKGLPAGFLSGSLYTGLNNLSPEVQLNRDELLLVKEELAPAAPVLPLARKLAVQPRG